MTGPWPVVIFTFDPTLHLFGLAVRSETVVTALAILAGVAWAGVIAGRIPIGVATAPPTARSAADAAEDGPADAGLDDGDDGDEDEGWEDEPPLDPDARLPRDDLLFIILGAIPGAVFCGRIGYGLLHLDWYAPDPRLLLDLSMGSAELTLAVLGGTLTGIYVGALLDAPVSRWLHVAIRPLLLTLAIAKLGQVLGGSGQGAFVLDGSVPAFAFIGGGPWGSLGPEIPAVPSQVYEALVTIAVLVVVGLLGAATGLRAPDGRLFAVGLGLWAFGRGLVAMSWRDGPVLGTLKAEQLICLAVAAIAFSAATVAWWWGRPARRQPAATEPASGAASGAAAGGQAPGATPGGRGP